jgi:LuxR family maltose regulon positive regulatory protein
LLFVHLLSADLHEAMLYARRQQEIAEEYNIRYLHAWLAYVFGYIDLQHNDLPGAVGYFTQAVRNRYVLHDRAALDSLVGLAVANQMLDREDDARAALQDLLDFAWESNNASYITIARTCQARLAMLQNDSAAARRWLQKADLTMDAGMLFYWLEIPRLTQVRVLMADSGEAGLLVAEEQLQDLRRLAQETHNKAQMIEILVLQACLYRRQERINDALASLEQAIVLASAGDWLRPFVEVSAELQDLVPRLSPKSQHKLFLQKVQREIALHSFEQEAPQGQAATLAEELTYREQEVLALLADEMSNQEIAQTLTISINTVKRHTGSVYRKLDVKNRRQAVTKARRLALLPAN